MPRALADDVAVDLVQLFKLLADETRLRIVHYLLQNDEIHVRAFCELLSQSQPAVSHHLALLREAGLIDVRREGKHNFYHLLPTGFRRFLDLLFASAPQEDRRIRFDEYVLSYSPPEIVDSRR
jgi:ArsR family transcriptional regulator